MIRRRLLTVATGLAVVLASVLTGPNGQVEARPLGAPLGAVFNTTVVAPTYTIVDVVTTTDHPHSTTTTEVHVHSEDHPHSTVNTWTHPHSDPYTYTWSETSNHQHSDLHTHTFTYTASMVIEVGHIHVWPSVREESHWHEEYICDADGCHDCSYAHPHWVTYMESGYHAHWETVFYPATGYYDETHTYDHPHTVTYSEIRYNNYDHEHNDTVTTNHVHLSDHVHEVTTTTNHPHITTTPTLVAGPPTPQNISADNSNPTYKMPQLELRPAVTIDGGMTVLGTSSIVWPLQRWLNLGIAPTLSALPYAMMPDGSRVEGTSATVNAVRYYGTTKADTDVDAVLYDDSWLATLAAEQAEVLDAEPSLGGSIADPTRGNFLLTYRGTVRLWFLVNTTMTWADGTTTTLDLPASVDVRNAAAGTQ